MDTFSLSEVLQMAEEIERNGVKFYNDAAEKVREEKTRAVMLDLAEKEKEHERTFRTMREEFCGTEDVHTVDPEGEVAMHIQLMADTHVFNLSKEAADSLATVQTPLSVLKLAMGFEKDTIVFFQALKEAVTTKNKSKVELMIQEEREHIRILHDAMKNVNQ